MNLLLTPLDRCALRRGPAAYGILALTGGLVVGTAAAFAQPTITGPLGLNPASSYPYAVSVSGSTVVGTCGGDTEFPARAWRWTSDGSGAGVTEDLGFIPQTNACKYYTNPYAVSADGSVVAGTSAATFPADCVIANGRAFRWTHDGGMHDLGDAAAYGVSGDGSVVVGVAASGGACRWFSDGSVEVIGSLRPDGLGAQALAASFDGSVVTGFSSRVSGYPHAFRWVSGLGMQDLGALPGGDNSQGLAISADGSTVVGFSDTATAGYHAFRWTQGGGMQDLGLLPGGHGADYARAFGVSADGRVVVGDSGYVYVGGSAYVAFVWTPSLGMVNLREYLASQDVDVTQFYPLYATGISPEGSAVVCGEYYTARLVRGLTFGCLELPGQPLPEAVCSSGTANFSITAAGTGSYTYQWQWEQVGAPNDWTSVVEGPNRDSGGVIRFIATGAAAASVGVVRDNTVDGALDVVHALRCVVTNLCGSVKSNAVTLTVFAGGGGDGNSDGTIDGLDIQGLVNILVSGGTPSAGYCAFDMNADGTVDLLDVPLVVNLLVGT